MANLKTPAAEVVAFRERHKLDQKQMDNLFGFASDGRATRRWEAEDAPYYVTILMAYADKFGIELMQDMAKLRDLNLLCSAVF